MRICTSLIAALLLLTITACEESAETTAPAPAPATAHAESQNPWDELPPDSIYGATAVENIRLTRVEIDVLDLPAGWDGTRIAALSDFNLGIWEGNAEVAERAVQLALAEQPDLIVLLGDYVTSGDDMQALSRVLSPLSDQNVLAVLGDRDIRSDSAEARIRRTFAEMDIRLLMNESVSIERNGHSASVAGIDPEILSRSISDQEFILATTGGSFTALLLAHSPIMAARAPSGDRPAVLAGNAFCGDMEISGTPRLSWYENDAMPNAVIPGVERLYRIRNNTLFITCGIGYSYLPIRLSSPPEVALITLRALSSGEPETEPADTIDIEALIEGTGETDPESDGG